MEELLQYKFRNWHLLAEAFTHCSWPDRALPCYQRLEFLGDAVLDLLITRHYALAWHAAPNLVAGAHAVHRHSTLQRRIAVLAFARSRVAQGRQVFIALEACGQSFKMCSLAVPS